MESPSLPLTITLHRGLYLAIIMDRYEGTLTTLTSALHRGLYVAIIMDRYESPLTTLTIALHRGLYLAIIMDRYEGHGMAWQNKASRQAWVGYIKAPSKAGKGKSRRLGEARHARCRQSA
jgi:hypothetical protein